MNRRLNSFQSLLLHSFLDDLKSSYNKSLSDIRLTDTEGWWEDKELCGGLRGGCNSPLHRFMFCEDGCRHTYTADNTYKYWNRDEYGRGISPYIVWYIFKLYPDLTEDEINESYLFYKQEGEFKKFPFTPLREYRDDDYY